MRTEKCLLINQERLARDRGSLALVRIDDARQPSQSAAGNPRHARRLRMSFCFPGDSKIGRLMRAELSDVGFNASVHRSLKIEFSRYRAGKADRFPLEQGARAARTQLGIVATQERDCTVLIVNEILACML